MPPDVGNADTSSDMVKPMIRMNTLRIGHDHEIEIGPPLFQPGAEVRETSGQDRDDRERDGEVREARPVPVQVLLVAELSEPSLVVAHLR